MDKSLSLTLFGVAMSIFLAFQQSVSGEKILPTWNAEDMCGQTVVLDDDAGILYLSHNTYFNISNPYSRTCNVTVLAKPRSLSFGMLFYFSKFEFHYDCSRLNVSFIEEKDRRKGLPVEGTGKAFCGHNTSLVEPGVVFNTTGPGFTLVFRWDNSYQFVSGTFILKIATFYWGPCASEHKDERISCTNKRCVGKEFHCHSEIDVCGGGEEEACEIKETKATWENFFDNIGTVLEKVIFWILIVAAVVITFRVLKKFSQKYGGVSQMLNRICSGTSTQATARYTPPELSLEMNRSDNFEPLRPHVYDDDNEVPDTHPPVGNPGAPPAYDSLGPPTVSPPLPPPPSYEEFQREEHKYKLEPDEAKK